MSLNEAVEIMSETTMFRNVDPKRLKLVAMMGEALSFRPSERLFEQGDEGDSAYVILDGEVDVLIPTPGGEISVAVLKAKEIFGEMAVLCDQPRTTAIAARGELRVLRLKRKAILDLLHEFPDIALEFIKVLASRLERTSRELAEARKTG
ncbi:MAG: cyclic nucleotide-binding domain-containing protein [Paracoccaceae bacterium]